MGVTGLFGEGHRCPDLEGTWAERSQNPHTRPASPDNPHHYPREFAAPESGGGGTVVGSGLGQSAGGAEEGLLSLCSRLSGDWEPDRPKHQIRTLSSDIPSPLPKPVTSLSTSAHQRQVGLVLPPPPTSLCKPRTPWVVVGAELEALTRSHLRPITCAAVGSGPSSEGPRDHTGGGQKEYRAGTSSPALTWPSEGCTNARSHAAV